MNDVVDQNRCIRTQLMNERLLYVVVVYHNNEETQKEKSFCSMNLVAFVVFFRRLLSFTSSL